MNLICPDYNGNAKPCYHYIKHGFCKLPNHFSCIEFIRRKSPILSPSAIQSYLRCRRRFYWEYIKGLESTQDNQYKLTGELLHFYLSFLHSGESFEEAQARDRVVELTLRISALSNEEDATPEEVLKVDGLILAYREKGFADGLKGKTEVSIREEFKELNIIIKGIVDLIPDGDNTIYDFKYTSRVDWFTLFTTKLQASIYLLLTKKNSITFRLIQRPALKKGKNETEQEFKERVRDDFISKPGKYVKDITFYRSEYDFDAELKTIKAISDEIRANIDRDIDFFYQNPSGCYFPGPCDYLPICESRVVSEGLYKRKGVNEGAVTG